MRIINILAIGFVLVISGCASFFNLYEEDFQCPKTENGQCVSIEEAYNQSFEEKTERPAQNEKEGKVISPSTNTIDENGMHNPSGNKSNDSTGPMLKNSGPQHTDVNIENIDPASAYRNAIYMEMAKLVQEPKTPIVMLPKTMRVLFLPYKEDIGDPSNPGDMLFLSRYVYFIADQPYWLLDGYMDGEND